jgi:hypothetical protein
MDHADFYSDRKYCPECEGYVAYLMSLETSYCASCGSEVRLFSKADWDNFHESIKTQRPKGGRPRKSAAAEDKESA